MLEKGERPPSPARLGIRSEQVNVRLSVHEKRRLEQLAKAKGFKEIADLLRASALGRAASIASYAPCFRSDTGFAIALTRAKRHRGECDQTINKGESLS
jgi:hypothetical protein